MAERVVVATLDIDESGAVRSIKAVEQQVGSLGAQTKATSDVFTARMFNMRTATMAFLGSFTAAGAIFFMKDLVSESVKANKEFAALSVSAENFRGALGGALADMLGINSALGETGGVLNGIAAYLREASAIQKSLREGGLKAYPVGQAPGDFMGPPAPPGYGNAGYDPDVLDKKRIENMERLNGLLQDHSYFVAQAMYANQSLGTEVGFAESAIEEIGWTVESTTTAFDLGTEKMALFAQAAQVAGATLGSAIYDGSQTAKGAVAQLFKTLSIIALTQSLMHLAAAYSSTTLIGMAATGGTPAQHKAAAAFWGKVAAASTAGALALGARSGGGGGGGGGMGTALAIGGSDTGRTSPQITVIVQGNVMANDDFGRMVADSVVKAIGDGTNGGSL